MTGEIFFGASLKMGVGRGLLVLGIGLAACPIGCGDDEAPRSSGPGGTGGAPAIDGSMSGAGGSTPEEDAQVRPPCPNPRIPEGELQNRASGPSVFGIVVGGDTGVYDVFGGTECGLAGLRICQRDTDTCTQSDAAGQFVLGGLPEAQEMEIAFEDPGGSELSKVLRLVRTGSSPINLSQTRILTREYARELLGKVGTELDIASKGSLVAAPIAPGDGIGGFVVPEGVVITLRPSGPAALYSLGSESPGDLSRDDIDPSAQATRPGGYGIFANVEPGDYTVRFERNGQPCSVALPGYGYGVDAEGNVRAKVLAGYGTTSIVTLCQ